MNQVQFKGNEKLIEGSDKMRTQKCLQRIQEALSQYDCELHPQVTITPRGNNYSYAVVAINRGNQN